MCMKVLPHLCNLVPEVSVVVFWDTLCFSFPSFCVLFPFFSPCPFVFFSSFSWCDVVWAPFSPFCSPLAARLFPFFWSLPLVFIKKRGVVQMVLLLGGFFSSLRFTLLNKKITTRPLLPKLNREQLSIKSKETFLYMCRQSWSFLTCVFSWNQPCSLVQDSPLVL